MEGQAKLGCPTLPFSVPRAVTPAELSSASLASTYLLCLYSRAASRDAKAIPSTMYIMCTFVDSDCDHRLATLSLVGKTFKKTRGVGFGLDLARGSFRGFRRKGPFWFTFFFCRHTGRLISHPLRRSEVLRANQQKVPHNARLLKARVPYAVCWPPYCFLAAPSREATLHHLNRLSIGSLSSARQYRIRITSRGGGV